MYDPATGRSFMRQAHVSKVSAEQRRGRTGRTSNGICYHMYSQEAHGKFKHAKEPEIFTRSLHGFLLQLLAAGFNPLGSTGTAATLLLDHDAVQCVS